MITIYVISFLLIPICSCQLHFEVFEIYEEFDNVFCDEGSTPQTTRTSLTQCTSTCRSIAQPLAGLFYDADTYACACRTGPLTDVGACVRKRGRNYQRKGVKTVTSPAMLHVSTTTAATSNVMLSMSATTAITTAVTVFASDPSGFGLDCTISTCSIGYACIDRVCQCAALLRYNPMSATCVSGCSSFGSVYTRRLKTFVNEVANSEILHIKEAECEAVCSATDWCTGYEIVRQGVQCWLLQETDASYFSADGRTFYTRNCA